MELYAKKYLKLARSLPKARSDEEMGERTDRERTTPRHSSGEKDWSLRSSWDLLVDYISSPAGAPSADPTRMPARTYRCRT